jgi:hypothetical protein
LTDADRADSWPPTSLRAPSLAVVAECVTPLRGCFATWALAEALPPLVVSWSGFISFVGGLALM